MKNKPIIFLILAVIVIIIAAAVSGSGSYTATEYALDTVTTVTAYGVNSKKAVNESIILLRKLESELSIHKPGSLVSQLNKNKTATLSDNLNEIFKTAGYVYEISDGSFDISIKPLADLWNIKGGGPVPSSGDITHRLNSISFKRVTFDSDKKTVTLPSDMEVDLGGVAKGYCADKIADTMKEHNVKSALIDLGGNVHCVGKNKGNDWKIGIQDPNGKRGEYFGVLAISDKCVVTSGAYERYFEQDGKVYHHILNPKTGYPSDSDVVSVSIVCGNSALADALSTAVYVMGVSDGMGLISSLEGIDCIIVDKNNFVYISGDLDFEITNEKYMLKEN